MFVSDASRQFAVAQAAAAPLRGELQDFGLAYARSLEDGRVRLQSASRSRDLKQFYDAYTDEIYRVTGQRLPNPMVWDAEEAETLAAAGKSQSDWQRERFAAFDAKVAELAAKHPELQVKTRDDALTEVGKRVRAAKEAAERPGVNVGWAGFGSFVGYGQAAMEDPVNVFATVLTGGLGGGAATATAAARATLAARLAEAARPVAATALREGTINAGIEAVTQPSVKRFNNEMGVDYTWGEAAGNVAMAGAAGGILAGGMHAAGLGLKSLLGRWDEAKAAGQVVTDAETEAAEKVLRDVDTVRRANPYPPGPEGDAAFADADRAVIDALKAGRPLPTEALTRFDANQRARILEFADGELSEGARADRRKPDAIHHSVARGERAEALAARVQADLDRVVDFSESVHRIDEDGIRHALKRHANDHLPLRREDLARIPEAVRAGEIVKADVGKTGQIGIEYRLPADGGWLHVHEELRKDKSLVFVTAYRRPDKAKPGPHGPGSGGPQRSPREGWPSPGSPRDPNMRAAPAERKSLPPELRPPAARRPETLVGWLKRQGGVNDADGWLAHMGVDNTVRPGLIAARGMNLDDAALRAWEEGFFPEFSERPTPDQLRLQIANDLGPEGTDRVRGADEGARLEWDHYDHMMAQLDRLGVDPYGKSWEDVQAAVRAARGAQRDEDALWRDAYAIIDPEGAKALDEEAAFAARTYGELLDEDVAIPTGLTDADNKPVMQSARELMDAWDDETMTWDSAIACFGKVA